MQAFKTNTQFNKDLQVWYNNLPIEKGQDIEVTIIPAKRIAKDNSKIESLTGTVLEYNLPFEPAITKNRFQ